MSLLLMCDSCGKVRELVPSERRPLGWRSLLFNGMEAHTCSEECADTFNTKQPFIRRVVNWPSR